jgi:hypothetical protein
LSGKIVVDFPLYACEYGLSFDQINKHNPECLCDINSYNTDVATFIIYMYWFLSLENLSPYSHAYKGKSTTIFPDKSEKY